MSDIKMPKISQSNLLDKIGSAIFEKACAKHMILVPHSGNKDFGIDYTAELVDETKHETLGHFISIQLKTHQNIKFDDNGFYHQRIRTTTANYWLTLNMPVILVLLDLKDNKLYCADAKKYLRSDYNVQKYESQKSIEIKVSKNDLFNFNSCLVASIEYDKYNMLYYSSNDSLIIWNLLSSMVGTLNRDCFLLVDAYEDMTNDALSLSEKYNYPFCTSHELKHFYEKMVTAIKSCLENGRINYDNYYEQYRTEFNFYAIEYFVKLVYLICDEIAVDKTNCLRNKLYKFVRLKDEIEKNGKPSLNNYWIDAKNYNILNDDFETIDGGRTWIQRKDCEYLK